MKKQKKSMKPAKAAIVSARTFDELLDATYGSPGTAERDEMDDSRQAFVIGEMLKQARKEARLTQEELARKAGTQKSYISRLEKGKCPDIQLSTLYRIFQKGLGRQLIFSIS